MDESCTVKQLEVIPPPVKRKEEFVRTSLVDGPDWRWRKACSENYCARSGADFVCSGDAYVVFAKRIQWLIGSPNLRLWLQEKWPAVSDIITVALDDKYNSMKSELNSTLIRVRDIDELCSQVAWITRDQARLYSKWFFDVSGICAISSWIEDHIIRPISNKRYHGGKELNDILLAYFCDKKYNMVHFYTSEEREVLRMVRDNRRMHKILSYVFDSRTLDPEVMEQIIQNFDADIRAGDSGEDNLDVTLAQRLKELTQRRTDSEESALLAGNRQGVEEDQELNYIRQRLIEVPKTQ